MSIVAHLSSFYSGSPIYLWVEDALTREYLTAIWGYPVEIAFYIAGNNAAVRPPVEIAHREGIHRVYGLIDRDFRKSNIAKWSQKNTLVFRIPRLEIENYALDAAAIYNCSLHNRNRTQDGIQIELNRLASLQPIWLACRRVLSEIGGELHREFPSDPKLSTGITLEDGMTSKRA